MSAKIITSHDYQPIADRCFDWLAYLEDREPDGPLGHGPSKQAAIADLLEQLEDQEVT